MNSFVSRSIHRQFNPINDTMIMKKTRSVDNPHLISYLLTESTEQFDNLSSHLSQCDVTSLLLWKIASVDLEFVPGQNFLTWIEIVSVLKSQSSDQDEIFADIFVDFCTDCTDNCSSSENPKWIAGDFATIASYRITRGNFLQLRRCEIHQSRSDLRWTRRLCKRIRWRKLWNHKIRCRCRWQLKFTIFSCKFEI